MTRLPDHIPADIAGHLDAIKRHFINPKITLLVRPDVAADLDADAVITNDTLPLAIAALQRRHEAEVEKPERWALLDPEIKRRLEPLSVIISRGDLERLDKVIAFTEAMAELFSEDFADDLWNLRNGMVPFEPGHEHYCDFDEDESRETPGPAEAGPDVPNPAAVPTAAGVAAGSKPDSGTPLAPEADL